MPDREHAFPYTFLQYTSRAGQAGAEVSKGKNYTPKKEFAYRMCAGRPTSDAQTKVFVRTSVSVVRRWW